MRRARPGSTVPQRRPRARAKDAKALRNVPPPPRRGVNSQKSDKARNERSRQRRTGAFRRAWAALRTLIAALTVTGGLGGAGYAGWRAFEDHGFLALRQVDVVGNARIGKAEILEKAGLELGTKLPSVPVERVEESLASLPAVKGVSVRRIFPSRIEIRVIEKEPVAIGYARGWYGLAADGTRIPGLELGQADVPVVDGFAGLDSTARALLGAFLDGARRELPGLYANFSQLSMRGTDGVEIVLRDRRLKVLLGLDMPSVRAAGGGDVPSAAGKLAESAVNKSLNSLEFLKALIEQQGGSIDAGGTVDLRVYGYAYVR